MAAATLEGCTEALWRDPGDTDLWAEVLDAARRAGRFELGATAVRDAFARGGRRARDLKAFLGLLRSRGFGFGDPGLQFGLATPRLHGDPRGRFLAVGTPGGDLAVLDAATSATRWRIAGAGDAARVVFPPREGGGLVIEVLAGPVGLRVRRLAEGDARPAEMPPLVLPGWARLRVLGVAVDPLLVLAWDGGTGLALVGPDGDGAGLVARGLAVLRHAPVDLAGTFSPDRAWLLLTVTAGRRAEPGRLLVELAAGQARELPEIRESLVHWHWSPDGRWLAGAWALTHPGHRSMMDPDENEPDSYEPYLLFLELAGHRSSPALPIPPEQASGLLGDVEPQGWEPDGTFRTGGLVWDPRTRLGRSRTPAPAAPAGPARADERLARAIGFAREHSSLVGDSSLRKDPRLGPVLHGSPVTEVRFDGEGRRLLTRDRSGATVVWDEAAGHPLALRRARLDRENGCPPVALARDGRFLVWGEDESYRLDPMDRREGTPVPRVPDPDRACWRTVDISPAGDRVLLGTPGGALALVPLGTAVTPATRWTSHHGALELGFLADGLRFFTMAYSTYGSRLQVWRLADRELLAEWELPSELSYGDPRSRLAEDPAREAFWVGCKDGPVACLPGQAKGRLIAAGGQGTPVFALAPGGRELAWVGRDGGLRLASLEGDLPRAWTAGEIAPGAGAIGALAYHPTGAYLLAAHGCHLRLHPRQALPLP